jgi:hypothetical protein
VSGDPRHLLNAELLPPIGVDRADDGRLRLVGTDGVQESDLPEVHPEDGRPVRPAGGEEERAVAADAHHEVAAVERVHWTPRVVASEYGGGRRVEPHRDAALREPCAERPRQRRGALVVALGDDPDFHAPALPPG